MIQAAAACSYCSGGAASISRVVLAGIVTRIGMMWQAAVGRTNDCGGQTKNSLELGTLYTEATAAAQQAGGEEKSA